MKENENENENEMKGMEMNEDEISMKLSFDLCPKELDGVFFEPLIQKTKSQLKNPQR